MAKDYVESRDGIFYLIGSRVPLDCIVREFKNGSSPESIRSNFSTLSLEQVYGAITFYLGNKEDVEIGLAERNREEEAFAGAHPFPAQLKEKLERAREQSRTQR